MVGVFWTEARGIISSSWSLIETGRTGVGFLSKDVPCWHCWRLSRAGVDFTLAPSGFVIVYDSIVQPTPPAQHHCWVEPVSNAGGPPVPAVVVSWQYATTTRSAADGMWLALVGQLASPDILVVAWVNADQLRAVRDDTPEPQPG